MGRALNPSYTSPVSFLSFDPYSVPPSYARFVRVATTIGAVFFAAVTVYGWRGTSAALASPGHDIDAILGFVKFIFFFAITGIAGGATVALSIVAVRCWTAEL